MTDRPSNQNAAPDPMARATLLRAAADGELSPEQQQALESLRASDPSVDRAIATESALRDRVASVMREPAQAPAALRGDIEALFQRERGSVGPAATTSRSFWAGRTVWLAAAAAIVLVASVSLVMQLPISQSGNALVSRETNAALINASEFITGEHDRCADFERYFEAKMSVRDAGEVSDAVVNLLGAPPTSIEFDDTGYEFAGMGRCNVPGDGASVHMIYRHQDVSEQALSLFVQENLDASLMDQDVRYRVQTDEGGALYVWTDGALIYYLFCHDEARGDDVSSLMKAPERELRV